MNLQWIENGEITHILITLMNWDIVSLWLHRTFNKLYL
jgi:hypothetical protein